MKIFAYIDRINLMHKLIKQKRTGTPQDLSRRLGLSTSRLHHILDELREMEVPIVYSRQLHTYYYKYEYEISIVAEFRPLEISEMNNTEGGSFLIPAIFQKSINIHLDC